MPRRHSLWLALCAIGCAALPGRAPLPRVGTSAHAADRVITEPATVPPPGLCIPVQIVEVYDGDTVTVEMRWRQRVRMLNCWTPEVRTADASEKARGQQARDYLKSIAEGKTATLWLPASDVRQPSDLLTFERVLGLLYLADDSESLSHKMRAAGHATQTRVK